VSVRYEQREIKQPVRVERTLVEASCDRCCKNAMFKGGIVGNFARIWGQITIFIQGGGMVRKDLCRQCSEDLIDWIERGKDG